MTLTKIRKRDGRLADFNEEKIASAIDKAFDATYKPGQEDVARQAGRRGALHPGGGGGEPARGGAHPGPGGAGAHGQRLCPDRQGLHPLPGGAQPRPGDEHPADEDLRGHHLLRRQGLGHQAGERQHRRGHRHGLHAQVRLRGGQAVLRHVRPQPRPRPGPPGGGHPHPRPGLSHPHHHLLPDRHQKAVRRAASPPATAPCGSPTTSPPTPPCAASPSSPTRTTSTAARAWSTSTTAWPTGCARPLCGSTARTWPGPSCCWRTGRTRRGAEGHHGGHQEDTGLPPPWRTARTTSPPSGRPCAAASAARRS